MNDTVQLFQLRNEQGAEATLTNYGATLTRLAVPDRRRQPGDVVLGFADPEGYRTEPYKTENPYFGAIVGRYGNRIRAGRFTLDGRVYQLATNNDSNHLHGGVRGFDRVVWEAAEGFSTEGPTLTLRYRSVDGEEGYPGNLDVQVIYTLTHHNVLRIEYEATTDQPTVVNLTNHSYFNLAHGLLPNALGHELTLHADHYLPVDETLIPLGQLRPVAATPMDFRQPHTIGERLGQVPGGYDHTWVIRGEGFRLAARVMEPLTGRVLEVWTDQPGVQFYSGNFLTGRLMGQGNVRYNQHYGFCLETQHFPDSPNHPAFPSTTLRPGELYRTVTEYRFSVGG